MQSVYGILLCAVLTVFLACGRKNSTEGLARSDAATAKTRPAASNAEPSSAPSAVPPPLPKVELEIGARASAMAFDKTSLTVPAGSEVHLVLKNAKPGTLPHNWVLVRAGTEAAVAAAGLRAGPAGDYLTPGPDVFAFTRLAQPGKTSEVTFRAPPAGTYPYVCTFPGHYLMMKGTLIVKP